MSALGIGPAVMINRIVLREGDTTTPHLAKVAKLRMDLAKAADAEAVKQTQLNPDAEPTPLDLLSGAEVDRLV